MQPTAIQRYRLSRRTRRLASGERVGRFARNLVWEHIESFVQRKRKMLLATLFMPLIVSLLFVPIMKGSGRWIFVGAMGISGPWFVSTIIILYSGAATPLMGLDGEASTADVLRKMKHDGWRLVNGIKIQWKADIDHILVGPPGILVVESKWSHNRWPMGKPGEAFMTHRLNRAVSQALSNRKDVEAKLATGLNAKVQAICVLWSSEDSSDDPLWIEVGEVVVIRGQALRTWLMSLTEVTLAESQIKAIWEDMERFAIERDQSDLAFSKPPRPTIDRLIMRSVVLPTSKVFLGLMLPLYGAMAISRFQPRWLIGSGVIFLLIGVGGLRVSSLRKVALGWIASSAFVCLFCVVLAIRPIL